MVRIELAGLSHLSRDSGKTAWREWQARLLGPARARDSRRLEWPHAGAPERQAVTARSP